MSKIVFPEFTGAKCTMMPFIQGDPESLPSGYKSYSSIIESNFLEQGEVGFLTIDEKFVEAGKSQRGYNAKGITRNVHIEVGSGEIVTPIVGWGGTQVGWGGRSDERSVGWGGRQAGWGGRQINWRWGSNMKVPIHPDTKVLIANSLAGTCRIWDAVETRYTRDGDLSDYINDYPESSGKLLDAGELALISVFTPHEAITQTVSANRQFFRIVGKGVKGREEYFTVNPFVSWN